MKYDLFFISRICKLVPKGITKVVIFDYKKLIDCASLQNNILKKNFYFNPNTEINFYIKPNFLLFYLNFFKKYSLLNFEILTDLTCVDFLNKSNRFLIVYNLLSIKNNLRIFLNIEIQDYEIIFSIYKIYKNANWLEREVWDLFGIFFANHPDLRRILTDYGFNGFPLRKDFPLTGFIEIRYDDEHKKLFYENIEFAQEFRNFTFLNSWEQISNRNYIKNKYSK